MSNDAYQPPRAELKTPDSRWPRQVRYILGIIYTQLLNRGRACTTLRQAVLLMPDNMAYRMQLGRAEVISILEILFDRIVKLITVTLLTVSWTCYLTMAGLYTALVYFLVRVGFLGDHDPFAVGGLVVSWGLIIVINYIPVGFERLMQWLHKQAGF